jgi:hypothetical protein
MNIFAIDLNHEVDITVMTDSCNWSIFSLNQLALWMLLRWDVGREDHMLSNGEPEGMIRVLEREAENVSIMSDLDLGSEPQSDVPVSILVHFL